ncbi:MAG: hypothetical protein HC836_15750 [Richelia sp. RM2_1_2]|nr:hypothetical protein [Richelia sp. RM2_1_2]
MSLNIIFNKAAIKHLAFLDFITVTKYSSIEEFSNKDDLGYHLWLDTFLKNEDNFKGSPNEYYHTKSCFNPIYSKIVGISLGGFVKDKDENFIPRTKALYGNDECKLMGELITSFYKQYKNNSILAGHNLNGFHIPFLTKRFLAKENAGKIIAKNPEGENVIATLPAILSEQLVSKPWEQKTLDTMQTLKFGSFYNTSLEHSAYHYGVPAPSISKENISGKFWETATTKKTTEEEAMVLNNQMSDLAAEYVMTTMRIYQHLRETM